jgi:hypothetical protein
MVPYTCCMIVVCIDGKKYITDIYGFCLLIYTVIQSSSTIVKDVAGEIIWNKNVNKVSSDLPQFQSYKFLTFMSLSLLLLSNFTKWKQLDETQSLS